MRVLNEGKNVWKIAPARRVAFIVDGAAYFDAFIRAIERAERSILIVSWDIDSQTDLKPGDEVRLIDEINRCVARKKALEAHVLNWDYAPIYAFEREQVTGLRFKVKKHSRVHFALDAAHPYCASHHQKLVVIDDAIAFCGGLDLTTHRWDTPEHRPDDPRRVTTSGRRYGPFHDVQIAVDGEAARLLGELARRRWQRATGRKLAPPPKLETDPWPDLPVDLANVEVGIARTEPACGGRPEIREVEQAFVDSIRSARHTIYAETQYLSSDVVRDALAAKLEEEDGPEVVLVVPREPSGWKEQQTIGVITARLVRDLRVKDRHDRLAILSPRVQEVDVFVHSKLMFVDDRLVHGGSANLSNRSMGVDTECDLLIESDEPRVRERILAVRNRLIAEHLGTTPEAIAEACARERSLIGAIESLRGGERTLVPAHLQNPDEPLLIPAEIADPAAPIDPEMLVRAVLPSEQRRRAIRRTLRFALLIIALVLLAIAWRFTPLRELIRLDRLVSWGASIATSPIALLVVMLVYTAGTLLMVPVNLLLLATGLVFGPLFGAIYAVLGSLVSAAAGYFVGRKLGADTVHALIGAKVHRIASIFHRRGLVAFATVRLLPVASFGLVNMLGGAMRIRFHQFMIGTLIGMAPGIAITVLFGGKLADYVADPNRADLAIAIAIGIGGLAFMSALLVFVGRRVRKPLLRDSRLMRKLATTSE